MNYYQIRVSPGDVTPFASFFSWRRRRPFPPAPCVENPYKIRKRKKEKRREKKEKRREREKREEKRREKRERRERRERREKRESE